MIIFIYYYLNEQRASFNIGLYSLFICTCFTVPINPGKKNAVTTFSFDSTIFAYFNNHL